MNLDEVKRVAQDANDNVRSMGVALSACIVPRVGKPGFSIDEDKMEIGMGIHGEPGIGVQNMKTSDEIVDSMMEALLSDMGCSKGEELAVLINGLGSTPLDELYIIMKRVAEICQQQGIKIYRSYVGEYATSMEMAGASISLFRLNDERKQLLDAPANTPFFKQF
jgi:dihydroxyacetone kinase-like protein